MTSPSKWTRICRIAVAVNILSLLTFTALVGSIAARKVANQIEEGMIGDSWIGLSFLWPSLVTAMLTVLVLRLLNDSLKKVFSALNFGLGLYTLYIIITIL